MANIMGIVINVFLTLGNQNNNNSNTNIMIHCVSQLQFTIIVPISVRYCTWGINSKAYQMVSECGRQQNI